MHFRQFSLNLRIWIAIAIIAAIDAVWMTSIGLGVQKIQMEILLAATALFTAISVVYGTFRRDDRLCLLGHVGNQLILGTYVLALLSYLTARWSLPLVDSKLIA